MNKSDRQRFVALMSALSASFSREADEPLLEGYWMGLSDIGIDDVERAVQKSIRSCKHFPRPAELRELAGASSPRNAAALAWLGVAKAARASKPPEDALAAEVVRHMGGAQRLGQMTTQELENWGRKEFERLYVILAEQQKTPHRLESKTEKVISELASKMELAR